MIKKLSFAAVALLATIAAVAIAVQPARAATGFYVSNGRLYDANDREFIMRGVNHGHAWYTGQTSSFAKIKALGANTIRVVLSAASGDRSTASDVSNVINLCKQNRLICVLEVHTTTGLGDSAGAITLSQAADYWVGIRNTLIGQERYVIINIGNEPIGNANPGRWTADTEGAIAKLRAAGLNHTLMVDGPNWGQDWTFTMRNNAQRVFDSDPNDNVIFSIHMYGVFDTAAEVDAYLNYFVSRRLPILVGEFGHNHSDGNPDENAIMATTQRLGLGYLGWSWSGNGGGVEYLDMATSFDANRLTSWGQRIFNGANGIRATSREASVYPIGSTGGGTTPPAGGGGTTPPAGTGSTFVSQHANRCLDVPAASTTNGTQLIVWDCSGAANQRFTHTSAAELRTSSGKCLDAWGQGTAPGTIVAIYDCTGGNNQKWNINSNGTIVNRHNNLCLDPSGAGTANGTLIQLWTCTGSTIQRWTRR
ncbi:MAG TPA: cellulase family glycosylhydrolase [Micromonosporaceae bacterium]|nr:cellulase family glycosylhydrolase [Micromonosporaceae bacterium]